MNTKILTASAIAILSVIVVFLAVCLEYEMVQNHKLAQSLKSSQRGQPGLNARQQTLHQKFEQRSAQDQGKYSQQQLDDAESLYQVANQKWGTPEAMQSLKTMIQKYPGINRTGCAELYLAQMSQGDDRARYLEDCIDHYDDSFYGDGVQVGAYARFLLAEDFKKQGDDQKAQALFDELKARYPEAIDHSGKRLRESTAEE